jgi:hypothetical protein
VTASPLDTPGWIEFNAWRTGLTAQRIRGSIDGDRLEAVLYLDRRGRVVMPPNNPYLAVSFQSDRPTPSGRTAAWVRAARTLLDELAQRGLANQVHLPPSVTDVRPFKWDGYRVSVRYTYVLDLPMDLTRMSAQTRKAIRRSERAGYTVERTDDIDAVLHCLSHSEQRQRFTHGLGRRELETARSLMGPDGLRMHVARDERGRPASAVVNLHAPGTHAIGWLGGNTPDALRDGVQLAVMRQEFADLAAGGATGIDLCGANIESVAEAKSHWGPELTSTYSVREYSLRSAVRYALDWRAASRAQRAAASRRTRIQEPAAPRPFVRRRWWSGLLVMLASLVEFEAPIAAASRLVG